MEQLVLRVSQNPRTIDLNFDELEKQLDRRLEEYKGAIFTEDSKDIAKKEVASLRKLKKEIDEVRKRVKKEWMKPYDDFEARMKRLTAKVDEPINLINDQVKDFEEKRRAKKKERISEIYAESLAELDEEYAAYIPLESICDPRWENVSTTEKAIRESITEKQDQVILAVNTIKAMNSEKVPEALELYRRTHDMTAAVNLITTYEQNRAEVLRREEERRRQEEERRQQAEIERAREAERAAVAREEKIRQEERQKAAAMKEERQTDPEGFVVPDIPDDNLPFEQPNTITVFYRVVATAEDLEAVEMAFDSIGIWFERRDG